MVVYVVLNTSQGNVAAVFTSETAAATFISENSMSAFVISEHKVRE